MATPRPYLSFSQMTTLEQSESRFVDTYIYDKKQRINRNMAYGSIMAESLEKDELSGDPVLDIVMTLIPKLDIADKPIEDKKNGFKVYDPHKKKHYKVPVLKDKNGDIPLLAIPDSAKKDYSEFYEYKTSVRKWTQKMVDESGQITFYATAIWLVTGKIPEKIELINAVVQYNEDGSLSPTGEIIRFKTKRTMVDILKMTARIRKAWKRINELLEEELLN